nr:MAG TPA: Replication associated protein [Bacteriophage sp.]
MGTLTLRPEAWVHAVSTARAAEAEQGEDFDSLPESRRLALIHAQLSRQITLMFKRWRKSGHQFRYLVVLEMHISGVIHYHVLLHEVDADKPMRHRHLSTGWPLGFTKWKLADSGAAWYVAKYLTKTLLARVRASQGYGGEIPPKEQGDYKHKF